MSKQMEYWKDNQEKFEKSIDDLTVLYKSGFPVEQINNKEMINFDGSPIEGESDLYDEIEDIYSFLDRFDDSEYRDIFNAIIKVMGLRGRWDMGKRRSVCRLSAIIREIERQELSKNKFSTLIRRLGWLEKDDIEDKMVFYGINVPYIQNLIEHRELFQDDNDMRYILYNLLQFSENPNEKNKNFNQPLGKIIQLKILGSILIRIHNHTGDPSSKKIEIDPELIKENILPSVNKSIIRNLGIDADILTENPKKVISFCRNLGLKNNYGVLILERSILESHIRLQTIILNRAFEVKPRIKPSIKPKTIKVSVDDD